MKLLRFGEFENEKPALELSNGKRIDVSVFGEDFNEVLLSTNALVKNFGIDALTAGDLIRKV